MSVRGRSVGSKWKLSGGVGIEEKAYTSWSWSHSEVIRENSHDRYIKPIQTKAVSYWEIITVNWERRVKWYCGSLKWNRCVMYWRKKRNTFTSVAGMEMRSWEPYSKCGHGINFFISMLSSQGLVSMAAAISELSEPDWWRRLEEKGCCFRIPLLIVSVLNSIDSKSSSGVVEAVLGRREIPPSCREAPVYLVPMYGMGDKEDLDPPLSFPFTLT